MYCTRRALYTPLSLFSFSLLFLPPLGSLFIVFGLFSNFCSDPYCLCTRHYIQVLSQRFAHVVCRAASALSGFTMYCVITDHRVLTRRVRSRIFLSDHSIELHYITFHSIPKPRIPRDSLTSSIRCDAECNRQGSSTSHRTTVTHSIRKSAHFSRVKYRVHYC